MLNSHPPDGEGRVSCIPPVLWGADVHAPQLPAVSMGRVLIPLHLESVLFDVVNGGEDHSLPVLLNTGEDRLSPETQRSRNKISKIPENNKAGKQWKRALRETLTCKFEDSPP